MQSNVEMQTSKKTSVLNLHMRQGESYHEFLCRYRTAFQKYHNQKRSLRPKHYSDEYELYRQQRVEKQSSSCSDEGDVVPVISDSDQVSCKTPTVASKMLLQSPANSAST